MEHALNEARHGMKVARTRQHENKVRSGLERCARSRHFKCSFKAHSAVGSELNARSSTCGARLSTLPRILFGTFKLQYGINRAYYSLFNCWLLSYLL